MLNLLLLLSIGYQLQKLFQFNLFFRLRYLVNDYSTIIKNKMKSETKSILFKQLFIVVFADLGYILILLINLFTINLYFIFCIYLLSIVQNIVFKFIKNKTFRKIYFTTDILLSIILLSLSVINSIYYHLDSDQLIKQILNISNYGVSI